MQPRTLIIRVQQSSLQHDQYRSRTYKFHLYTCVNILFNWVTKISPLSWETGHHILSFACLLAKLISKQYYTVKVNNFSHSIFVRTTLTHAGFFFVVQLWWKWGKQASSSHNLNFPQTPFINSATNSNVREYLFWRWEALSPIQCTETVFNCRGTGLSSSLTTKTEEGPFVCAFFNYW